jgi:hypothetical protein
MPFLFKYDNRVEEQYGVWGAASGRAHKGIDVDTTSADTVIYSPVGGYVEYAYYVPRTASDATWEWGWHVRIFEGQTNAAKTTGKTKRHVFAHCKESSLKVAAGQTVTVGQPLAVMGMTGNAYLDKQKEHVHYQVDLWNGAWVNQNPCGYCNMENKAGTVWNRQQGNENETGVITMKAFDVYAQNYAAVKGSKAINIQWFDKPDVNSVCGNNMPDGRYQVYETDVSLANLSGYKGAKIRYNGAVVYAAVIANGSEITDISVADAESKFGWYAAGTGSGDCEKLGELLRQTETALKAEIDKAAEKDKAILEQAAVIADIVKTK